MVSIIEEVFTDKGVNDGWLLMRLINRGAARAPLGGRIKHHVISSF